ncbi:MAG: hydantoinase/oxoprolinase family protein [Thermoleophilia bacterium]|nr:hydantoinase/oxoprolinase family protein [Thermoleophilia bacterium]
MRIGIDVGGTNTDAVLMDGLDVLAEVKTATTPDVTSGILTALGALLAGRATSPDQVRAVMIGTTHFTNAIVEGKRLSETAAIRLGLPATESLPPMVGWPERLRTTLGGHVYLCHGGHEFDGREISPFDPGEIRRAAAEIGARGIRSVAVSSVFSPVNAELELEAARILEEELPGVSVSLSHEIGRIGLLERENATIMNACLRELATQTTAGFRQALAESGIGAPVYLSQNDGTLMGVDYAERYPVATFASGPTNSMRGAALLSGEKDCAVVDIGGTTSDIGVLQQGFPREAAVAVEIGGVRTNFRMPDVLSIGLGGGSLVRTLGALAVGPDSVGYELTSQALVFGGATLTATDLAVAGGLADIGDRDRVAHLDPELVRESLALIERTIAEAVDRMKTSAGEIPLVVVGGGSILLRDELPGASRVVRPEHFAAANAIGAAIAQVGGEVERVYSLDRLSRDEALADAKDEAIEKAVQAGATADSVRVMDIEEVGLAYLPGNAVRVKVKAVGELELGGERVAAGR